MFSNEVVLVTGASRGIGRAIAEHFAKRGAIVVGTATSAAGAEKITNYLQAISEQSVGHVLDVSSQDSIDALMAWMKDDVGMPEILVNNAAITQDNLLMRMKPDQWDAVINTNLSSVFRMVRACMRPMIKARKGKIINIASVVGFTGNFGQANYTAAKAGVIGYTKTAAQELATYGITVNAVAPGFIATDMTDAMPEKAKEAILSKIPMAQPGKPEDIATAVLFLASSAANYITGETIHVNGGMYMG